MLICSLASVDGRGWHAIAETTRLIAQFESLFFIDSHETLPGNDEASMRLRSDGKTTLVALMNTTDTALRLKVPLPGDKGEGYEFYSGETVKPGQTVEVALEPGAVRVYVFGVQ